MAELVGGILKGIKGVEVRKSPEFKKLTTIGTGGRANALVLPRSRASLSEVVNRLSGERARYFIFGRGSNILVPDEGIDMVAVGLCKYLTDVRFNGTGVIAEGGTSLPRLAALSALSGLTGLEELSGIPGAVGGALMMNAGSYGREMGELIQWVEIIDENGEVNRVSSPMIDFQYRKTVLPIRGVVIRAYLKLGKSEAERVFSRMKELNVKRKQMQPWREKTFGSVFKNPSEKSAGELIEETGLKGLSVGGAWVSEKHANFIVNRGKARTSDVLDLIEKVKRSVFDRWKIHLEPEVKYIGGSAVR